MNTSIIAHGILFLLLSIIIYQNHDNQHVQKPKVINVADEKQTARVKELEAKIEQMVQVEADKRPYLTHCKYEELPELPVMNFHPTAGDHAKVRAYEAQYNDYFSCQEENRKRETLNIELELLRECNKMVEKGIHPKQCLSGNQHGKSSLH